MGVEKLTFGVDFLYSGENEKTKAVSAMETAFVIF